MRNTNEATLQKEESTRSINESPPWSSGLKATKRIFLGLVIAAGMMLAQTMMAASPATVPLGSCSHFAVLAGTTTTTTGGGTINGDVGLYPAGSQGIPPAQINGTVYNGDAIALQAQTDLTAAYNDAAGRTLDQITVSGNIAGQTLAPGLYWSASSVEITGDLTLDAGGDPDAVWIFQVGSTLTTAAGAPASPASQIILAGSAQAKNIFWQVGSSATLGTYSIFKGTIMANISVSMDTDSVMEGRALARTGAVTYNGVGGSLPPGALDITVTAENFNTNKGADYYGATVGYLLSGVDAGSVASAKVELYDALNNKLVENTSKSAEKVNNTLQGPHYSSAFIVKAGTYTTSSTWNFGAWTAQASIKPAKAVVTLTDIYGLTYVVEDAIFLDLLPAHPTWISLFPILTYTAGANGSITGTSPQAVDYYGADGIEVTAVPDGGHGFIQWSDGVLTAVRTDLSVQADISVTASFTVDTADLVVVVGVNGTTTGSVSGIPTNTDTPVTAAADLHYNFTGWTLTSGSATFTDAGAASTNVQLTGADGSSATVTANFAVDTFTLTSSAGPNGSITPSATVDYGTSKTFTITSALGYHIEDVLVDGLSVGAVASHAFTGVDANHTISCSFAIAVTTANLTMAVNGIGTVSPVAGEYTVDKEAITPISATPGNIDTAFTSWSVSGSAVVADENAADTTVTLSGDATVTANFTTGPITTLLNGVPVTDIGGDEGSVRMFKVTLPAGQTLLTVETTAGVSGDCDMYMRHSLLPTLSSYDAKSTNEGNEELITIHDPASGDWYVMLKAYATFSGVTLTATYTADAPAKVTLLNATQGAYADKVRLTWTAVGGATAYEIWSSEVNNIELAVIIETVDAPVVTYDDMLTAKSSYKYYYWVRAVNASYTGGFSDYAYGTTIADNSIVDLKNGVAKTGISGVIGSMRTYRLVVPAGQTVLDITVSGGTGDCDINVGIGETGSRRYSVRSETSENIQYESPEAGNYYINIYGKTAYAKVTLMAKYMQGAPKPPTTFAAGKGTFADRIVLTWKASSGATSYDVYKALKTTSAKPAMPGASIATVSGTEYEDTDVVFGAGVTPNLYYYWLKAHNSDGFSKETPAAIGNLMPVPAAAGTIAASNGTYFDKIRVTWAKKKNVTSYEVYRTAGDTFVGATLVGGSVEASNHASNVIDDVNVPLNTLPATKYYYWIKAINNVNNESSISIKPDYGYVSNKGPATVTATKGTLSDGKIRVDWKVVSGATSYDVYKDGSFLSNSAVPTFEETPGNNLPHMYNVKAKYNGYESAFSPTATGFAADAPSILASPVLKSASTNLYDHVLVSWGAVSRAQTYRLYRSEANVFPNDAGIADVDGLTYEDIVKPGGIVAGVKYYYWAAAVNGIVISKPSASKAGMAAAVLEIANFDDPAGYPDGQTVAVAGAAHGVATYYSIVVPAGTTRLIATLSGAATAADDCDVYAKLGSYPTTASFNKKGVENKITSDEVLTVSNPAAGTWYVMLYGTGTAGYSARTLTVACYAAVDIYLTTVPPNDMNAPFKATFKGKVVDASGKGIPGLILMARNPMTGISSYLTAKTNASGMFTYSDIISTEGEHTFDFFFTVMPDPAKGTASHTVCTKNTSLNTSVFDFTSYLKSTPVPLSTNAPDDLAGMQAFLNTSNGWDDNAISATYKTMWIEKTVGKVQAGKALIGKLDSGLYMFFYGVEGAGAGNDTALAANLPVSGLSPVPLVVHVEASMKDAVATNLNLLGIIDDMQMDAVEAGRIVVVTVTSLDSADADKDISLSAYEQLSILSNIADKDVSVVFVEDGKYSDVLTKKFKVTVGGRDMNVITSAFEALTQEE
ncbi:MAG TPA: hypothetical protein DET40_21095 [Lentisphaeria bacterium]|nr:MAG: hypothetical protein A2X45_15715 [Lentisphaerae bacterium GWF2_50_93]HCE46050.1 hypothetical protein [Lentisphaeria bacterium]